MQDPVQDIERAWGCLCFGVRFKVAGALPADMDGDELERVRFNPVRILRP